MNKKMTIHASALAISLALLAAPAAAGGPKPDSANVVANANCLITDGYIDKDVMVTAILEQKEKIGPAPDVGDVRYILQQHIRGQSGWLDIVDHTNDVDASFQFPTPAGGETVEVDTHDFLDFCGLVDPSANSIRAVVEIEVTNSNDQRNTGQTHTGRCISLPNPC
ncbi:MAG TPA: hypothetical protein VLA52_08670 [Thermohalobaculum sp.]|nr:hypothetical protein [Thermohalobaculum sp.]